MNSSAHTPGPYLAERNFVYALNEDGSNRMFASVQAGYVRQPRKIRGADIKTSDEEAVATARLIAAAPELLEALENFLADHAIFKSEQPCPCNLCRMGKPAIAKALGKEPS